MAKITITAESVQDMVFLSVATLSVSCLVTVIFLSNCCSYSTSNPFVCFTLRTSCCTGNGNSDNNCHDTHRSSCNLVDFTKGEFSESTRVLSVYDATGIKLPPGRHVKCSIWMLINSWQVMAPSVRSEDVDFMEDTCIGATLKLTNVDKRHAMNRSSCNWRLRPLFLPSPLHSRLYLKLLANNKKNRQLTQSEKSEKFQWSTYWRYQ